MSATIFGLAALAHVFASRSSVLTAWLRRAACLLLALCNDKSRKAMSNMSASGRQGGGKHTVNAPPNAWRLRTAF